ncbi:hypothetical protein KM031_17560 (plasmid) [Gemmobacter fulvus]|uniref:Uncharacterized protein n=1 Tax=Gemmobacter fulvus TaxID=2840474 RepID=A0A975P9F6_9RHOB|nr:hypothetical protein [Gemmobacter fulvus]MBT9246132.1 hypothetical protein [Gemmobacter fulvus]QWK92114.1 hypothetical protein KM031_17560 [Gemmobacter fulvus]
MTAELPIALANIWKMESAQLMGMGEAGVTSGDGDTVAQQLRWPFFRKSLSCLCCQTKAVNKKGYGQWPKA